VTGALGIVGVMPGQAGWPNGRVGFAGETAG
jgi:hypothetical protein